MGVGDWPAASAHHASVAVADAAQRVLFYTDGISEARDATGEFYPVGRAARLLGGADLDFALEQLYGDVLRHAGGELNDDSAALLLARGARCAQHHPTAEGSVVERANI